MYLHSGNNRARGEDSIAEPSLETSCILAGFKTNLHEPPTNDLHLLMHLQMHKMSSANYLWASYLSLCNSCDDDGECSKNTISKKKVYNCQAVAKFLYFTC